MTLISNIFHDFDSKNRCTKRPSVLPPGAHLPRAGGATPDNARAQRGRRDNRIPQSSLIATLFIPPPSLGLVLFVVVLVVVVVVVVVLEILCHISFMYGPRLDFFA